MSDQSSDSGSPRSMFDPVTELGEKIYIRLAGSIYATGAQGKPDPKELAKMSLKIAEAFHQAYREINAAALEKERKRSNFNMDDLDLGPIADPKKK